MRLRLTLLTLLLGAGLARAGGDGIAGRWKVTIFEENQNLTFWLMTLEVKDGKLAASAETIAPRVPPTKVTEARTDGDLLRFNLNLANGVTFRFEGKLPRAGGKKVFGSVTRGSSATPAFLEATGAKNAFELNQEILTRSPSDPRVFNTVLDLIGGAKEQKVAARDVQEWVDAVLRTAEGYGPTLQLDYSLRLLDALQKDYPAVAIDTGAKVEKMLDPAASPEQQLRLLNVLAAALKKAGRDDEAAKITARIDQAEDAAYRSHALEYKVEKYDGKASRPVLIELFTGAQCPPCVAADLAFDGLEKTYGGGEVVLLQYHMHIPGPDPLTSPDNDPRSDFYARSFKGTPAIYFNGRPLAPGGGGKQDAEEKYKEYREIVSKLIQKAPAAKLTATATRKGDEITLQADVSEIADAGKAKLRLVLVEDWVRYKGGNGLPYHHRVVRAMPGGPDGFAVDGKGLQKSVTIDLGDLRRKQNKYLDEVSKESDVDFPQRPLRLRDLHAVAFVQSDDSGEILAAVNVPVKGE